MSDQTRCESRGTGPYYLTYLAICDYTNENNRLKINLWAQESLIGIFLIFAGIVINQK
jgi:hypothetical protein